MPISTKLYRLTKTCQAGTVSPVSNDQKDPKSPIQDSAATPLRTVELELMRTPSIARMKPGRRQEIALRIVTSLDQAGALNTTASGTEHGRRR